MKNFYKVVITVAVLLVFFSFVLACTDTTSSNQNTSSSQSTSTDTSSGTQNSSDSQKSTSTDEYTIEYKLAVIDKGGYLDEDDPIVSQYRIAINNLKPKVNNTETEISDIAVRAQEILRDDHGINLTILKILRDFDASIPDGTEKFDLVEIAAAYMTLLVSE